MQQRFTTGEDDAAARLADQSLGQGVDRYIDGLCCAVEFFRGARQVIAMSKLRPQKIPLIGRVAPEAVQVTLGKAHKYTRLAGRDALAL
ncbi:MAG TPA: hypothetical protein DHU81_17205 [Hyphomonas sp.]|nr:hypothetical protein [Hyphomonas sp.]